MSWDKIIYFHVCIKIGHFWCWKSTQPQRVIPSTWTSSSCWSALFHAAHRWGPVGAFSSCVRQVRSLPWAQGCQPPAMAPCGLSDRFYMHGRCLPWALCFSKGLLLRRKVCLTPVVSLHCSEWIALHSWCLNCLNTSSEHYFNGLLLGSYTLRHTVY